MSVNDPLDILSHTYLIACFIEYRQDDNNIAMNRLGKSPTILGNAKAEETYRIILSVLEILCSRHSNLRAELEILKEAIVTWRDYLN